MKGRHGDPSIILPAFWKFPFPFHKCQCKRLVLNRVPIYGPQLQWHLDSWAHRASRESLCPSWLPGHQTPSRHPNAYFCPSRKCQLRISWKRVSVHCDFLWNWIKNYVNLINEPILHINKVTNYSIYENFSIVIRQTNFLLFLCFKITLDKTQSILFSRHKWKYLITRIDLWVEIPIVCKLFEITTEF